MRRVERPRFVWNDAGDAHLAAQLNAHDGAKVGSALTRFDPVAMVTRSGGSGGQVGSGPGRNKRFPTTTRSGDSVRRSQEL